MNLYEQALEHFEELVHSIAELHAAQGRLERAMDDLAAEYERLMRPCSLILYPHRRGRATAPYKLYWNSSKDDSESSNTGPWAEHSGPQDGRKTRKLMYLGPLTDQAIYDARRWDRRDTIWDFDRRAQALNAARSAVSRVLDPATKALRYRLPYNPALLLSAVPGGSASELPSCPPNRVATSLPPSIKEALSSGWMLACRLAFVAAEYALLRRNYDSDAPYPLLALKDLPEDPTLFGGGLYWSLSPDGISLPKLSHRVLERHRIPRRHRRSILKYELARRQTARLQADPARIFGHVRVHSEAAFLAVDRALLACQVLLPRSLPPPEVHPSKIVDRMFTKEPESGSLRLRMDAS